MPILGVAPARRARRPRPAAAARTGQGVGHRPLGADGGRARAAAADLPGTAFLDGVVRALEDATGLRFCCNRPYSGTEVIEAYGAQHLETGEAILYTSADSVMQIATHVDRLSEADLYAACEAARAVMTGEHAVGRVIARPFEGEPGAFRRREGRHDFSLVPPSRSYLEEIQAAGAAVHGVGKIHDLFAGVGIDVKHPGRRTRRGSQRPGRCCASCRPG